MWGRRLRREDGQAMVELALVLPLVIAVVLAVVQVGLLLKDYLALTDAVRVGARQAVVSRGKPDPAGLARDAVRGAATDLSGLTNDRITVTSTWQPGADVAVAATYPFEISVFGLVLVDGELKSETKERVE